MVLELLVGSRAARPCTRRGPEPCAADDDAPAANMDMGALLLGAGLGFGALAAGAAATFFASRKERERRF